MPNDVSFEMPNMLSTYLSILSKNYKKDDKLLLLNIVSNSSANIKTHYENDENGSYIGHAISLHLPDDVYADILSSKISIQDELCNDLNVANATQYEYVAKVFLYPQGDSAASWRKEAEHAPQNRNIETSAQLRIWCSNKYRVFLSHKSSAKAQTAQLKEYLELFGISCFVAHENIHPTKEWMHEIENALFSMDALVALITDDFHNSEWTDQEIGVAIGRRVPIIPVKLEQANPYGFIGKLQALSCTWEKAPLEIVKLLIPNEKMKDAYISAVSSCPNYNCGNILAKALPFIPSLSELQATSLISSYTNNTELQGSFGFNGTKPYHHGEGLQHHILRVTGKDYAPLFDALS